MKFFFKTMVKPDPTFMEVNSWSVWIPSGSIYREKTLVCSIFRREITGAIFWHWISYVSICIMNSNTNFTHYTKTQIRQMAVSELKEALRERGFDSSGLKQALHERLREVGLVRLENSMIRFDSTWNFFFSTRFDL